MSAPTADATELANRRALAYELGSARAFEKFAAERAASPEQAQKLMAALRPVHKYLLAEFHAQN